MSRGFEWLLVVIAAGLISTAALSMAADPLSELGPVGLPFWAVALIILMAGLLASLVLIDLRRAFLTAPAVAVLAAVLFIAVLIVPSLSMGHYAAHLGNFALIRSIPVFIITAVLMAIGAMAGTILNTSVREYDL